MAGKIFKKIISKGGKREVIDDLVTLLKDHSPRPDSFIPGRFNAIREIKLQTVYNYLTAGNFETKGERPHFKSRSGAD